MNLKKKICKVLVMSALISLTACGGGSTSHAGTVTTMTIETASTPLAEEDHMNIPGKHPPESNKKLADWILSL